MRFEYERYVGTSWGQRDAVGNARATGLPGDESDICIVHSVWIPNEQRGQGIGTRQNRERTNALGELGFKHAICTVNNQNEQEIRIMQRNGWEKLKEFEHNSLWYKNLSPEVEDVQD